MSEWPPLAWVALGVGVGALGTWLVLRSRGRPGRDEFGTNEMAQTLEQLHEGVVLRRGSSCTLNDAAAQLLDLPGAGSVPLDRLPELARDLLDPRDRDASLATTRSVAEVEWGEAPHTLELTAGPLAGGGRFLVIQDLTGVTRLDHRRRDFVANASHELQTPIAALIGMLELLEDAEDEVRMNLLERAQSRAQALSDLTRDLMGLARAEDPDWKPSLRTVSIEEVFDALEELFRPRAEKAGLELSFEVDGATELIIDRDSLRTILSNLVDNALAHTSEGSVTVSAAPIPDGGVRVVVTDTGSGIEPEHLPRVFERFYRGDPRKRASGSGSGLGLSIVRHLLARLGGRVAVRSRPGEGTRFELELPPHPNQPRRGAGQAQFL